MFVLYKFCHFILIQKQLLVVRFCCHSFMALFWSQFRRNFIFSTTATATNKVEVSEKFLVLQISVHSSEFNH
jgi:hypothetical protein